MDESYVIATASTSDLTREYLNEHNIPFISYMYILDGKAYEDDCLESTRQEIYKGMREGKILSTSAINEYTYLEFFKGLLEKGKNVIFLDMSKELSSSYVSANNAAQEARETFPDCKLEIVDTCCVSGGLGMLVEEAVTLHENGSSFEEVLEWIENNKLKIAHRFTVDDLNWLKRGGRVSNASALVGTLLSIKPVLYVPDDGSLTVASKVRGRKTALNSIIESIKNELIDSEDSKVRILHADCLEDAQYVKDSILQNFTKVKDVEISSLGVVIGAHCGPGLFTIFYMAKSREAK